MEDLEEVITYRREALTLCPLGDPDHSSFLNNIANVVLACYEQSGKIEDLEDTVSSQLESLTLCHLATNIVSYVSTTLPKQFLLAVSSRVGWRISKR
jgi:hypothetical protein